MQHFQSPALLCNLEKSTVNLILTDSGVPFKGLIKYANEIGIYKWCKNKVQYLQTLFKLINPKIFKTMSLI